MRNLTMGLNLSSLTCLGLFLTIIVMPGLPTASFDQSSMTSLLDMLLAEHLLTDQQYKQVKLKSATAGQSTIDVLKSMHILPEAKIAEAQAKMLGIPYISLATVSFSPQALSFLSRSVVERFVLIPFLYEDATKTLSIAMANPIDLDALGFVRQKTALNIKSFAADPQEVKDAIEQQYQQALVGEVGEAIKE